LGMRMGLAVRHVCACECASERSDLFTGATSICV
jgi:hypothetical protein